MNEVNPPKVFVSHATEDKLRFVRGFAIKLREKGIDAWVDEWEIHPGDSLVQKIFEEGIKESKTMVIVLSQFSVKKPWVREELSIGVVKKIEEQLRIIPVVIDDCEIPESLRGTLYVRVDDFNNYDNALNSIVNTIFKISDKPPLGQPPAHIRLQIDKIPGISEIDTKIFKVACEAALNNNSPQVPLHAFANTINELQITDEDLFDSLDILEDRMLIKISKVYGKVLPPFRITTHGFENYGKHFIQEFNLLTNQVLLSIINHSLLTNGAIASHLNQNPVLIEAIMDMLVERNYIKVSKFMGSGNDHARVNQVTSQGKRFAQSLG